MRCENTKPRGVEPETKEPTGGIAKFLGYGHVANVATRLGAANSEVVA
jgi:hypothetical protein